MVTGRGVLCVGCKWKLYVRLGLLLLVGSAVAVLVPVGKSFRSIARDLAITQAKNQTSDLINDAISRQMASPEAGYERIIYFEKDLQGRITALKTNMAEMNRLKTEILDRINGEILALDTNDIGIPLGNILVPGLFSGKGPRLPVRVISISNSDGEFSGSFSQAGINQTLHQLSVSVCVDVTILVLNRTESFRVTADVVVAETIIVGEVPETFLDAAGILP